MTTILLVGVGGFLGANVRFAIASWSRRRRHGAHFPLGTLIANLAGSFLMGMILGILADRIADDRELRLLIVAGFLGAETTFSTFAVESIGLIHREERYRAFINVAANTLGSLTAAAAGLLLAWSLTEVA